MNHTTFTMQKILNQPMDPNICKRILQQIKSPNMQQSFAMTNDDSLSQSWINPPKRPNIPPPSQTGYQSRRPAIKHNHNNEIHYNTTQSFYQYDQSHRQIRNDTPYYENKNFLETITNKFDNEIMNNPNNSRRQNNNYPLNKGDNVESIVSPLDPNITMRKPQQSNHGIDIWGHLCGNIFNAPQQIQNQIEYDEGKSKFQRKKIFDSKAQTLLQNTKNSHNLAANHIQSILLFKDQNSHISLKSDQGQALVSQKSVKQAIDQLKRNKNSQIADFVQVITITMDLLLKAQDQRKFLLQNVQMVYQLTTSHDNEYSGLIIGDDTFGKVLQRMNFTSISDMVRKISMKKLIQSSKQDVKQFQKKKNKVAQSLENMLLNFSQIQRMIEEFMRSPDAIYKLNKVHSVLRQNFTKDLAKNTLQQIMNLLKDVRLFKYQKQAFQLEYLWDCISINILSQEEFINGFTRLNGLYRQQSQLGNSRNLESQLSKLGFVKN